MKFGKNKGKKKKKNGKVKVPNTIFNLLFKLIQKPFSELLTRRPGAAARRIVQFHETHLKRILKLIVHTL